MASSNRKRVRSNRSNPPNQIRWKGNLYDAVEPESVESIDELIVNVREKTHYETNLANAPREDKPTMQATFNVVTDFVTHVYTHGSPKWNPSTLKTRDTLAVYYLSKRKIGSSARCYYRVVDQLPFQFAFKVVDVKDFASIVPQEFVDRILALNLTGLQNHQDHDDFQQDLIRMQLLELYFACYYKCRTETVGERLFELPSARVRKTIEPYTPPQSAVEFVGELEDKTVVCFHTWPCVRNVLHALALEKKTDPEDKLLIKKLLRPLPPNGGYVKANRFMELFGNKLDYWQDCMEYSPRESALSKCIATLMPLLEKDIDPTDSKQCQAIRNSLLSLQGENKSHYVRPSLDVLGAHAIPLLQHAFDFLPNNKTFVVERITVNAIRKVSNEFWEESVDLSTQIFLLPKKYGLSLIRSKKGHLIFLTPSFFMMFAQNVPLKVRFRIVKAFLTLLQLLQKTGNTTAAHVEKHRRILCSFLMALEFGQETNGEEDDDTEDVDDDTDDDEYDYEFENDSEVEDEEVDDDDNDEVEAPPTVSVKEGKFNRARLLAMDSGYFQGVMPGLASVSRAVKLGHCETLYMRLTSVGLGKQRFGRLLIALRILRLGQSDSPIELSCICPGGDPESGCPHSNTDSGQQMYLVGKTLGEDHPLYGGFLCKRCSHIVTRNHHVQNEGLEAVQVTERKRSRNFQQDLELAAFNNDEEALQWKQSKSEYLAEYHQKRKARGVLVTSTGSDRKRKGKLLYPKGIAQNMAKAAKIWIKERQEPFVMWPDMVALLSDVVAYEEPNYRNQRRNDKKLAKMFQCTNNGDLFYYYHGFVNALEDLIEAPKNSNSKKWPVKNYTPPLEPLKASGNKNEKAELREKIMDTLYPKEVDDDDDDNDDATSKKSRTS